MPVTYPERPETAAYLGYAGDGGITDTDRRHLAHLADYHPHGVVSQRLCEEIRRQRHNGKSAQAVYDDLPVTISRSWMDVHARGDCRHPEYVPRVDAHGVVTQVVCALLRMACWRGVSQREAAQLPAESVDQSTVWHHVSGECEHVVGIPGVRQETVTRAQCAYWCEQRPSKSCGELASGTGFSASTVSKHTRGACGHDVDHKG